MTVLEEVLRFNEQFVKEKGYLPYQTTKFPDKGMVILSCMDTRLTELLPRAMNLRNGDAKMIKNAGAVITEPFGSVMRSIFVAIHQLKAKEVYIIGHHECGMIRIEPQQVLDRMRDEGVTDKTFSILRNAGINLETWLQGFESVYDSVKQTVKLVEKHPLFPQEVPVHGLVIHPETGKLELVTG